MEIPEPLLFSRVENHLHMGKYRLPYELILADSATQHRIPNSNGFFTISEADQEVKRLDLPNVPGKYTLLKHFQIQFDFKNLGATTVTDVQINITLEDPLKGESKNLTYTNLII